MLDFAYLNSVLNPDQRLPVAGNEHRMIRVAFDMFRLQDRPPEELWQVQADDDGNEFLVRNYSLPEEEQKTARDWSVLTDKKQANLTVYYKNIPVHRITASQYSANTLDKVDTLRTTLQEKLASEDFVMKMLDDMPISKIADLAEQFGGVFQKFADVTPKKIEPNVQISPFEDIKAEDILRDFERAPQMEREKFLRQLDEIIEKLPETLEA